MGSSGVYDPERPWQGQIDRDSVEVLLRQWLPEALERFGFEALWTPLRLIRQLADGNLEREAVLQVLARYPYLRIPPHARGRDLRRRPGRGIFRRCRPWCAGAFAGGRFLCGSV